MSQINGEINVVNGITMVNRVFLWFSIMCFGLDVDIIFAELLQRAKENGFSSARALRLDTTMVILVFSAEWLHLHTLL